MISVVARQTKPEVTESEILWHQLWFDESLGNLHVEFFSRHVSNVYFLVLVFGKWNGFHIWRQTVLSIRLAIIWLPVLFWMYVAALIYCTFFYIVVYLWLLTASWSSLFLEISPYFNVIYSMYWSNKVI